MKEIKFRLKIGNKVVGYEKAVIGKKHPYFQWRYSHKEISPPWVIKPILHDTKEQIKSYV